MSCNAGNGLHEFCVVIFIVMILAMTLPPIILAYFPVISTDANVYNVNGKWYIVDKPQKITLSPALYDAEIDFPPQLSSPTLSSSSLLSSQSDVTLVDSDDGEDIVCQRCAGAGTSRIVAMVYLLPPKKRGSKRRSKGSGKNKFA